ncbi:MAG: amidohydrolase family protein, partial [Chloroflexota bacterium]
MTLRAEIGEQTNGSLSQQLFVSSDSHVVKDPDLWANRLPSGLRDRAPQFPPLKVGGHFQGAPGGNNPKMRLEEMAIDGVSAEVLYPSFAMELYAIEDPALQEACFRAFNDWLIEYCSVAPDRLIGVGTISTYDIDRAVQELERCRKMGLRGGLVWLVPRPDLPFNSDHYDRFWAAAQNLDMPISFHTVTGFGVTKNGVWYLPRLEQARFSAIETVAEGQRALFDIVMS